MIPQLYIVTPSSPRVPRGSPAAASGVPAPRRGTLTAATVYCSVLHFPFYLNGIFHLT